MNSDFSRIITLLRKERKISQKKAAADLGVSQALLSHYEKGIRECGLDFLVRVSEYYGVSCDYLLGRSPEPRGSIITSEMIPEAGNEKEKFTSVLGMNAALSKKLILNSVSMLCSLLVKAQNEQLFKSVSGYIMTAVYKSFRIVYSANDKNDKNLFSVPDNVFGAASSSSMLMHEAEANLAAASPQTDTAALSLNATSMSEEYGPCSSAMMNIIKNSEASIKKLRTTLKD